MKFLTNLFKSKEKMKAKTNVALHPDFKEKFDRFSTALKSQIWNDANDEQRQILINSGYDGESEATKHLTLQQCGRANREEGSKFTLRESIGMVEPQCGIVKPVESSAPVREEYDVAKMSMPVEYAEKAGFITGKWYVHNFKRAHDGMHSLSIIYLVGFKSGFGYGYGFDFDGIFDPNTTLIHLNSDLYHEATEEYLIERFIQYADFTAGLINKLPRTFGARTSYKIGEWYAGVKGMNSFKVLEMNHSTGKYSVMYFGKDAGQLYKEIPFRPDAIKLNNNSIRVLLYTKAVKRGFRRKDLSFKDRYVYIGNNIVFSDNSGWNTEVITCKEASVLTGVTVL